MFDTDTDVDKSKHGYVERFRPETFDDIQGNNKALRQIKDWCRDWAEGDPPILLHGPAGTGKTSTAFVVADFMDWHLNQVNASSSRTAGGVDEIVDSMRSSSYAGQQMVLLDEIDSIHHATDLTELASELREPSVPVIMTANDEYDVPSSLKRTADDYQFSLQKRSRKAKLKKIDKELGLDLDGNVLDSLANRDDLRSAINDLQIYVTTGSFADDDGRTSEKSGFETIESLIRGNETEIDMAPNEIIWWLDKNWRENGSDMGKNIRGLEVGVVFDMLSQSNVFLERAKTDDYRSWKFADAMLEATADARLTDVYGGYMNVDYPTRWRLPEPKVDDDSDEARVYRKLSGKEDGRYGFSGSYSYFREVMLPLILDLPYKDRREMALEGGLDGSEVNVLDLDADDFEEWSEGEPTETVTQTNALEW